MSNKEYIVLKNIEKTYSDGYLAVKDINFSVQKGEFITLLGPSGCGKTTILKMLAGFEYPTLGNIFIDNVDIKDLPPNRRPTVTVFQDYALFPNMTVKQNIEFGLKIMRKQKSGVDAADLKEKETVKNNAEKKAARKIKSLTKDLENLNEDIAKLDAKYESKPEWNKIKKMRWHDYEAKVIGLESKKQNQLKNGEATLDLKLNPKSTRYDKTFIELKANFNAKLSLDKEYDKLTTKKNDIEAWISYWSNYGLQVEEEYEKKYTTRKLTSAEINERARVVIETVGLTGKEHKYPNELSGGMQQRVALARAIVVEPEIILLDEPLSALDAKVRGQMQMELKRLHKELGLTFILVTHDQEEALSLSTRILVMSDGTVQQYGEPKKIYDEPVNRWVASFIGNANFFRGIKKDENLFEFYGTSITCDNQSINKKTKIGEEASFLIRPEDMNIVDSKNGIISAKITNITYKGILYNIIATWNEMNIEIETTEKHEVGEQVGLKWNVEDVHFFSDNYKGKE